MCVLSFIGVQYTTTKASEQQALSISVPTHTQSSYAALPETTKAQQQGFSRESAHNRSAQPTQKQDLSSIDKTHKTAKNKNFSYENNKPAAQKRDFSRDMITGQDYSLFYFTASPLGHALRLSSSLMGDLYAAADDQYVLAELHEDMHDFCYRVLDLNSLFDCARMDVAKQLQQNPEKGRYLLSEVSHFQERTILLLDTLTRLVGNNFTEHSVAAVATLIYIVKKTGQILAI